MLIAIDTSTEWASLALAENAQVIGELGWQCGQSHSQQLLKQLDCLLAAVGVTLAAATGIVVAKGPGSFNGLRVGLSTAKGLAFGLGVPIVGIGTLEAAAYQHAVCGLPVRPVFGAGRSEFAVGLYGKVGGTWQTLELEHLVTLDSLIASIKWRTLFCGEAMPFITNDLKQKLGNKAVFPPPAAFPRRAAFLAELGIRRIKAGDVDDVATLQPVYLRKPPITERKHQ